MTSLRTHTQRWRQVALKGREATAIAPVCVNHLADEDGRETVYTYSCCPPPHIEVGRHDSAARVVRLLNNLEALRVKQVSRARSTTLVLALLLALALVALLSGCKGTPTGSGAPPDDSVVVQLRVWSIPTGKDVQVTITAVAQNPGLVGQFYDSELDVVRPYPVTLFKTTEYITPIYYPPGSIIAFSATATARGLLNETVVCEWLAEDGRVLSIGSASADPFSAGGDAEMSAYCLHATS